MVDLLNKEEEDKNKMITPAATPATAPAGGLPPPITPPPTADVMQPPPPPQLIQETITTPQTTTTTRAPETVTTIKQPERTTTTYTPSTVTKEIRQTKQEKQLLQKQTEMDQAALDLQKKRNAIEVEKAKDTLAKQQEIEAQASTIRIQRDAIIEQAEADLNNRITEYNDRYKEYKNTKIQDFWEDKTTGSRIAAALAVGLGALGSALTGGKVDNTAFKIISDAIDRDFAKQKQQLLQKKESAEMAKEGIQIARTSMQDQLNNINLKQAAALESVANKYATTLAQRGIPEAQIAADENIQKLNQAALQKKLEVEQSLRKQVQTETERRVIQQSLGAKTEVTTAGGEVVQKTAGGKQQVFKAPEATAPTETQAKAGGYARRMIEATKDYDKTGGVTDKGAQQIQDWIKKNTAYDKLSGVPLLPSFGQMMKDLGPNLSQSDRRAFQAQGEIITATLRKDSGAAIGAEEWQREYANLFPAPGDDEETKAQKRRTLSTRTASMMQEAGRSAPKLEVPTPSTGGRTGGQVMSGEELP